LPAGEDQKAKFERVKHLFDLEEAKKAAAELGGFTTAEVLENLRSLERK
jgi:hypothetical protein